jgi:hypothetical protein
MRGMTDETADETDAPPLGTLTIGVYRVNRETGEKAVIKPSREVKAGLPLLTSVWPPCLCYRCAKRNG